jgi:chromosome segregation ATPase
MLAALSSTAALLFGLLASPAKFPSCPGARVVRTRSPQLCDGQIAAELRAARMAASDAANAEARLRSMVAAANRNADALAAERDRALEDLRDLRDEAEAAATLASQDISGLEETVADLQTQLASARSEAGAGASPEAAEALRAATERASALEEQLASSRREAAFAQDEVAELRARCSLAEAEADAMDGFRQEAEELREELRRSEARRAEGSDGSASDGRVATLEAQVAHAPQRHV